MHYIEVIIVTESLKIGECTPVCFWNLQATYLFQVQHVLRWFYNPEKYGAEEEIAGLLGYWMQHRD